MTRVCLFFLAGAATGLLASLPADAAGPGGNDVLGPVAPVAAPNVKALPSLSPQMEAALRQLTDGSYDERQKAVEVVQQALADQIRQMLTTTDPEAQARLAALMEFDAGLARWALDALKLPAEERAAQLKWGVQPAVFPLIGRVYSSNAPSRIDAIKDLGKMPGPEASWLLARLLADDQREIYLAAMEAVWDREATGAMVDALWNRAVEAGLAQTRVAAVPRVAVQLQFRGRNLGVMYSDNTSRRALDNDIATDVLIQFKSPLVAAKIKDFIDQAEQDQNADAPNGQPQPAARLVFMPYQAPTMNVLRLVETYKVKEALPSLIKLAGGKVLQRSNGSINNVPYTWSNRTAALAMAVKIIGQDPADYKLKKLTQAGNMWTTPDEADENAAVKKLQDWWETNKDQFLAAPGTQPGRPPA